MEVFGGVVGNVYPVRRSLSSARNMAAQMVLLLGKQLKSLSFQVHPLANKKGR